MNSFNELEKSFDGGNKCMCLIAIIAFLLLSGNKKECGCGCGGNVMACCRDKKDKSCCNQRNKGIVIENPLLLLALCALCTQGRCCGGNNRNVNNNIINVNNNNINDDEEDEI